MPKREPKAGDFYLLPFAGPKRDLLVRVIGPGFAGHHQCSYAATPNRHTDVMLSSCHRVSPARAARILGVGEVPRG